MPIYNKLVRDLIPEIICADNKTCDTIILDDATYATALKKKLHEELAEYEATTTDADALEELSDLLELIHALTAVHNSSPEALELIRQQKAHTRGGFEQKIFLVEVHDDEPTQ